MDDFKRLTLIVEAVKYCKKVKGMGMPASCYTKALREPIFFLWELRFTKKKIEAAQYRSKAAVGMTYGKGELMYDHCVPFNYLQDELLGIELITTDSVSKVLERHGATCLITKDEDKALNDAGLSQKMPRGWDEKNHLARYHSVNIDVVCNSSDI